jgi:hypothetical protein
MKDDRASLRHILECLDAIRAYTAEGRDRFLTDRKTQKATLRELQELAESTQRLSSHLKEKPLKPPGGTSPGSEMFSSATIWASIWPGSGLWLNATYLLSAPPLRRCCAS